MSESSPSRSSPTMTSIKPILTAWPLAKLKPHPAQALYFGPCGTAADEALRQDLKANGQRDPIHILPDGNAAGLPGGTVLDGNRRAQQLAALGQTEAKVLVRHDLAGVNAAKVVEVFLGFNGNRRQLSKLAQARAVLGMLEAKRGSTTIHCGRALVRKEELAAFIGLTGRTLSRYAWILEAPIEVQRAFEAEQLPLILAERVARELSAEKQTELASKLARSEPAQARAIVEEYISPHGAGHDNTGDLFESFMRSLKHYRHDLDGRVGELSPHRISCSRRTLVDGRQLIAALLRRAKNGDEQTSCPPAAVEAHSTCVELFYGNRTKT